MNDAINQLSTAGWSVSVSSSRGVPRTLVERNGEEFRVRLWEKINRRGGERVPSGVLVFSVLDDDSYSTKPLSIADTRQKLLETQLERIPALLERALERRAKHRAAAARITAEWEAREREIAVQREMSHHLVRQQQEETTRRTAFLEEATAWKRCVVAREYLEALRARAGEAETEWIEWAEAAIEDLDPIGQRLRKL